MIEIVWISKEVLIMRESLVCVEGCKKMREKSETTWMEVMRRIWRNVQ